MDCTNLEISLVLSVHYFYIFYESFSNIHKISIRLQMTTETLSIYYKLFKNNIFLYKRAVVSQGHKCVTINATGCSSANLKSIICWI